jgi:tetratricopeptide (TPR) repeat protein
MFNVFKKRREQQYAEHKALAEKAYSDQNKTVAVRELELALKAMPDNFETWCQYGDWINSLAAEHMGGLGEDTQRSISLREQAEKAIRKSLELNPRYALAHYLLANIYWGSDFRAALAEFEKAAELDGEYSSAAKHAQSVVDDFTYSLKDIKVYRLQSLQSAPMPMSFEREFYFEHTISSVVIDSCWFGGDVQRVHLLLFCTEQPNFAEDKPIGMVTIRSDGRTDVVPHYPDNWPAMVEHMYKVQNFEIYRVE